ncbi:MAG: MarC family protein [Chlamydiales bacterium]
MNLFSDIFNMAFLFFIIMDPFGNLPLFVSLLKHLDPKRQRAIIVRELLIALLVMVLALFFGYGFFQLLNVTESSLQISGGIILFIIALRLIFSHMGRAKTGRIAKDPLIVPLAVPAVAGPGILATITLYAGDVDSNNFIVLLAILIAWIFILPILLFAPSLKRFLGENGIVASEKLFGYIVVLVSIEMTVNGFIAIFSSPT